MGYQVSLRDFSRCETHFSLRSLLTAAVLLSTTVLQTQHYRWRCSRDDVHSGKLSLFDLTPALSLNQTSFLFEGYLNLRHSIRIRSRRYATSRGRRLPLPLARHAIRSDQRSRSRSSDFSTFETLENFSSATWAGEGTAFLFGESCE